MPLQVANAIGAAGAGVLGTLQTLADANTAALSDIVGLVGLAFSYPCLSFSQVSHGLGAVAVSV